MYIFIQSIHPHTYIYTQVNVISACAKDFFAFVICFFIVFFGFVISFYLSVSRDIHAYTHVYMHTSMYTYTLRYQLACIHYLHTLMHACMHTDSIPMRVCLFFLIHLDWFRDCTHACIYIHTHIMYENVCIRTHIIHIHAYR
jgi:hypothetical protein